MKKKETKKKESKKKADVDAKYADYVNSRKYELPRQGAPADIYECIECPYCRKFVKLDRQK